MSDPTAASEDQSRWEPVKKLMAEADPVHLGPMHSFQALQFRLADMEIELQAARTYLRQAAWMLDAGHAEASRFCAMAKAFVTETASRVADQCLQLHGGYGYLADYGIEKIVRDLRVHRILEGTSEIMREIVARRLVEARA